MIHRGFRRSVRAASVIAVLFCLAGIALGQSTLSDLKPSSILFFNKYTSSPSAPQLQDTQINITNVNPDFGISVHMFMVDGGTCSIADFFLSLSKNQTASFLASDFDPGVQGYIVAVASSGGPTQFNYLIGDEFIREQDGKLANLQAVGFAKISAGNVVGNPDGTADLIFNGAEYDRFPVVLAASSFNSQVTHSTNLALYSPMSNLMVGNPTNTTVFTLIFDDNEVPRSTTVRVPCFIQFPLLNFRVTGGNVNSIVPAGATGWIKLNALNRPLMGAILTKGPVFNGGHNLHAILYLATFSITIPDF